MTAFTDPLRDFARTRSGLAAARWETAWAQADAALAVVKQRGDRAEQAFHRTGAATGYGTIMAATAAAFPPDTRRPDLSFSHHRAAMHARDPGLWLDRAADNRWSVRQMIRAMRESGEPCW